MAFKIQTFFNFDGDYVFFPPFIVLRYDLVPYLSRRPKPQSAKISPFPSKSFVVLALLFRIMINLGTWHKEGLPRPSFARGYSVAPAASFRHPVFLFAESGESSQRASKGNPAWGFSNPWPSGVDLFQGGARPRLPSSMNSHPPATLGPKQ